MIALDSPPAPRRLGWSLLTSPSAALFMCVFTSQAGVLVLSPILVDLARDFDVSTAVAGQLRIVAAPVAALVAVAVVRAGARLPYRLLLAGGAALVAVGSVASAGQVFAEGHPAGVKRAEATVAFRHEADPAAVTRRVDEKKRRELTAELADRLERQVMANNGAA